MDGLIFFFLLHLQQPYGIIGGILKGISYPQSKKRKEKEKRQI